MTTHDDAVTRYFEAWNATGTEEIGKAVAAAFTPDARYTDPLADVTGHDGLTALVDGVHQQFPGFVFTLIGTADGHHGLVRFSWELGPEGAPAPIAGSDVAALAEDGRIRSVSGFLDRVPPQA